MERNELLKNIKEQFKKLIFATENYTCTTKDGKNLIVMGGTDVATGLEIYEVNADGTQKPLENGEYKLMDGRSIMITDNVISEVKMPEAPAAEAPAEEVEMCGETNMEDMPVEMPESEDEEEDKDEKGMMAKRIEALEAQITEIMNMLSGTMEKTSKMSEQIVKLSDQPAGEKANLGKKMIQDKATKSNVTMDEIREIAKKLNKN
jgi:hypothetical protein